MAQCDAHSKISKHTNQEFSNDLKKEYNEAVGEVQSMKNAIHSMLDAQDDYQQTWDEIKELQKMSKASEKEIIESSVLLKKNIDPEALINMMKWDMATRSVFKPSALKHTPEVQRFLNKRFQKGTD